MDRSPSPDSVERALIIRRDALARECSQIQREYEWQSNHLLRRHTEAVHALLRMSRVLNTFRSSRPMRLRAWRAA